VCDFNVATECLKVSDTRLKFTINEDVPYNNVEDMYMISGKIGKI